MSASALPKISETAVLAHLCRRSFREFVREFWECVPGAGTLVWNWHLDVFCDELQQIAERVFRNEPKAYDLVCNVSAGTSKSTVFSILFQPWTWTRMPSARHLTASHTADLVLDLSNKSRAVIASEKYRDCYPDIVLRSNQDTKGYFANTQGGDRYTCTVAGKSPMGFHSHFLVVDDPLDPKKALSEAEIKTAKEFHTNVIPTRKVDKLVSVTMLVMQRLGLNDPTDVVLSESAKEGAAAVRHLLLPGEISNPQDRNAVSPPELVARYSPDGLMDPNRLPWPALRELRARGELFYATQVLQRPYSPEGGMFRETYFLQRVKAAPYHAKRIRGWDRAATAGGGCRTAGVLMARGEDNNYYVEHVVVGQWEPDERNAVMRATALRDRTRYGPSHEPLIYVEAEGGSSGRDAWKGVARALAGFPVREDRPTGRKEARAEPWACQCAAKTVHLVDNGESEGLGRADWDINDYVQEHVAFPNGRHLDQVDASSMAFNLLCNQKSQSRSVQVLPFRDRSKHTGPRLIVCSEADLALFVASDPAVLVSFRDPSPIREGVMSDDRASNGAAVLPAGDSPGDMTLAGPTDLPGHALAHLLGSLQLAFADLDPADHQATWDDPLDLYGRPARDVKMDPADGKRLWKFLLGQKNPPAKLWVFADSGDRRAVSAAIAVTECIGQKKELLYFPSDPGKKWTDPPPNEYVYRTVKAARALVVG